MAGTNKKLVVPNKASPNMPQPEYGTDMRAIEQYATPGGPYASLTGPGETDPTGYLVQTGGVLVLDSTGFGFGVIENGGAVYLAGSEGAVLFSSNGVVSIEGYEGVQLDGDTVGVSFDGGVHFAIMPIEVTGSRGGNAALASLLTALQSCGLITDSTTP